MLPQRRVPHPLLQRRADWGGVAGPDARARTVCPGCLELTRRQTRAEEEDRVGIQPGVLLPPAAEEGLQQALPHLEQVVLLAAAARHRHACAWKEMVVRQHWRLPQRHSQRQLQQLLQHLLRPLARRDSQQSAEHCAFCEHFAGVAWANPRVACPYAPRYRVAPGSSGILGSRQKRRVS